jgi:GNAT superfamily N-acetyltransferase
MNVFFYNDKYISQLVEFISKVWEKDMTEERLVKRREKNLIENPYAKEGGFPIAIAIKNNKIIGHHAGTPIHILANGETYLCYWLSGLNVLPEGRRQGIAKALQNLTNQLPLKTSFWVIEATLRVKKRLKWTIVGKIPEYIKILNHSKFIDSIDLKETNSIRFEIRNLFQKIFTKKDGIGNRLFKSMINIYNQFFKFILYLRKTKYKITQVDNFDGRIDILWNRNKDKLKYAQVRKSKYLNWQFKNTKGWIKIVAEDKSGIIGYAILSLKNIKKERNLKDVKVLSIIDIFWEFTKPEVYWELLWYAEHFGINHNAVFLVCSISEKQSRRILLLNGYCRIPGTVYFGFHCNEKSLRLSSKIDDWYLTRGDADAAGSLGP